MHNLVIDIGNTNHKLAVFNDRELIDYQIVQRISIEVLQQMIRHWKIEKSTISSVAGDLDEVVSVLKNQTGYVPFSTEVNNGIKNHYRTRTTLGLDRWAKVIAANHYYHGRDCFMIDAGTCITYDLLNYQAEYYGGSISPGIGMRFAALNHYTGRLPKVEWNNSLKTKIPQGTDTVTAIENGVLQGAINEIEGFITHQNKINTGLTVLITGGDAAFLLEQLKNSIFAPQIIHDPYLVLKGLNEVIAFEYVQKN
jgi:type III pantothenate kinase